MAMAESKRTENLLALILLNQLKGAKQAEKAQQLSVAGFTNVEIADLLQTKAATISQTLYLKRRGTNKRSNRNQPRN
jgi:DNA-binding LacI/PurR family transcriptional regulator